MSALAIASATGSHLVLQPTRTTFHPGHEVFGRRCDKIGVDSSATPNARGTIAINDDG